MPANMMMYFNCFHQTHIWFVRNNLIFTFIKVSKYIGVCDRLYIYTQNVSCVVMCSNKYPKKLVIYNNNHRMATFPFIYLN